ncbi:glycoside hydrolase family protein [Clostridium sp. JS66]|uniref:glycoside hydrolase family protein n=1 Tax=Clostridium sp. JS66 TaxID=3064705 RepID=UPI003999E769
MSLTKIKLNRYTVTLNQQQFDSLCNFAYDCGSSALFSSTLYVITYDNIRDSSLKRIF